MLFNNWINKGNRVRLYIIHSTFTIDIFVKNDIKISVYGHPMLLSMPLMKKPSSFETTGFCIFVSMVPGEGLEPSRHCWHRILSPARLPIPPSRLKMRAYYSLQILLPSRVKHKFFATTG